MKNKSCTDCNQNIDTEVSDLLIAISVKAKRLAQKFIRLNDERQIEQSRKEDAAYRCNNCRGAGGR